jgi:hypothetical protein
MGHLPASFSRSVYSAAPEGERFAFGGCWLSRCCTGLVCTSGPWHLVLAGECGALAAGFGASVGSLGTPRGVERKQGVCGR